MGLNETWKRGIRGGLQGAAYGMGQVQQQKTREQDLKKEAHEKEQEAHKIAFQNGMYAALITGDVAGLYHMAQTLEKVTGQPFDMNKHIHDFIIDQGGDPAKDWPMDWDLDRREEFQVYLMQGRIPPNKVTGKVYNTRLKEIMERRSKAAGKTPKLTPEQKREEKGKDIKSAYDVKKELPGTQEYKALQPEKEAEPKKLTAGQQAKILRDVKDDVLPLDDANMMLLESGMKIIEEQKATGTEGHEGQLTRYKIVPIDQDEQLQPEEGQQFKFTATNPQTGERVGSNDGVSWQKIQ